MGFATKGMVHFMDQKLMSLYRVTYACMFFVQVLTVVKFRPEMSLAATTNVEPFI